MQEWAKQRERVGLRVCPFVCIREIDHTHTRTLSSACVYQRDRPLLLCVYKGGRVHTATHLCVHTATHYNTLQHTATYCNIMQHTATHCVYER